MDGKVVNLRTARKKQARAAAAKQAEANRVAFGRTKAERTAAEQQKAIDDRRHAGHAREPEDGGERGAGRAEGGR